MRKLILNIACSLDGYIAGPSGKIDWLFTDDDYGIEVFMKSIDLIVMGRKTYEMIVSFGSWPYGEMKGEVFSNFAQDIRFNQVSQPKETLESRLISLKNQQGKDIWLLGGGEVVRECLRDNLIDEMIVSIHPILLGEGISLFPSGFRQTQLQFMSSTSFPSGLVQVQYRLNKWVERVSPPSLD